MKLLLDYQLYRILHAKIRNISAGSQHVWVGGGSFMLHCLRDQWL